MANDVIVEAVSLDTQVFVATGFGFKGKSFEALKKHLADGRLRLVVTEITIKEVKSRIRKTVTEELTKQRAFINGTKALVNSSLPDVQTALKKLDPELVAQDLCHQFDTFLEVTKATILDVNDLKVGDVFEKYFAGQPPFGNTEAKKHEFPDAFAIEALALYADENDLPMFVVSDDDLFQEACAALPYLVPKKTISEVLDHVASDDAQLASFVRTETIKRIDAIRAEARENFEDRYYWVEGENGDAEVHITQLTPTNDPDIITINREMATLQWTIKAHNEADLSYDDSATAVYSEGDLVYVEHREEEVQRDIDLVVEIEASYEQMDPSSFDIMSTSVIEPTDGFAIKTQNDYGWPYK
jgi:hypothetical protein